MAWPNSASSGQENSDINFVLWRFMASPLNKLGSLFSWR